MSDLLAGQAARYIFQHGFRPWITSENNTAVDLSPCGTEDALGIVNLHTPRARGRWKYIVVSAPGQRRRRWPGARTTPLQRQMMSEQTFMA